MSVAQVTAPGRGTSPLMSNNPFRNKIVPQPAPQPSQRPVSNNPFLDFNEVTTMPNGNASQNGAQAVSVDKTADVFSTMKVSDDPNALQPTRSRQANSGPRKPEARDGSQLRSFPRPPGHKPSMSEEEQRKLQSRPRAELDIFADPVDANRDRERRPRRNSESSVRDRTRSMDEEERRRRERKNRESKRATGRSAKPNKKLDVIDKLDVTSIYGMGLFHHDGPFDACNPHRNRKKEKYAPMQAFPKDSINMVMGGSGPVNKRMDYDKFHGYGQEAHIDFNEAAIVEGTSEPAAAPTYAYNPTAREAIHGDESVGLGTSTFLEGAPASRAAIQRRESEYETQQVDDRPGLSRKKSLAQKIRGVRPRDRLASPGELGPASPPLTGQSDSAVNPFFKNYDQKDKDNTTIQFAENQLKPTRPRAPSSPKRNELERRNTTEDGGEDANKPSGLLGRMKSLKTSKRPVRRDTSG